MNSVYAWFKSLGWVAAIGMILTAVLFAIAGIKSKRYTKRAQKAEAKVEELLFDKTKKHVTKAEELQVLIAADKAKAAAADRLMHERLDQLGKVNESIDDVADRFNSVRKRLRDGQVPNTTD